MTWINDARNNANDKRRERDEQFLKLIPTKTIEDIERVLELVREQGLEVSERSLERYHDEYERYGNFPYEENGSSYGGCFSPGGSYRPIVYSGGVYTMVWKISLNHHTLLIRLGVKNSNRIPESTLSASDIEPMVKKWLEKIFSR